MKRSISLKIRFICSIALLFIGAGLLVRDGLHTGFASAESKQSFQAVIRSKPAQTKPELIQGKPVRLQIPSLNIDLAVADGVYNAQNKTWTLSKDKAHYALITPLANNQQGNTFIYGHNRKQVFGSLAKIKPGAEIILHTDNGHIFTYVFRTSYETSPKDDTLFKYTGSPILTVQTCSGAWYQNRQLFSFDLEKVI